MASFRLCVDIVNGYGIEINIGQLFAEEESEPPHDTDLSSQAELAEPQRASALGFTRSLANQKGAPHADMVRGLGQVHG